MSKLDIAVHILQVLIALLGARHFIHVSRKNAAGVRNRLDDVSNRAVANVEIEAQDVRSRIEETASTTDSKIEALAEQLDVQPKDLR